MSGTRLKFTKKSLLDIAPPVSGQGKTAAYYDTEEKGLMLLASAGGTKTFYLYTKVAGRPERIKLGRFPDLSVENARKQAAEHKASIIRGINPNTEKKKLRAETTFGELFHEYMERYSKKHKKSWQYDEREVKKFLSTWFNRKLSSFTKQEIQRLHERIGEENGLYQANRLLERIRAIFNKAIEWGWDAQNPANGIKKFKEKSRDRFLQPDELPRFFEALAAEQNETIRDYLELSLLIGARKGNMLAMRWDQLKLDDPAQWRIPETKNGDPLTLPLSSRALEILRRRHAHSSSEWVFPSPESKAGYLQDPKRAWKRVLQAAGIEDLRLHDLRRSLGSWLNATGANSFMIGRSLGHKSTAATQVYARLHLDPIRASLEKATEAILQAGKVSASADNRQGASLPEE
jgi:integrase